MLRMRAGISTESVPLRSAKRAFVRRCVFQTIIVLPSCQPNSITCPTTLEKVEALSTTLGVHPLTLLVTTYVEIENQEHDQILKRVIHELHELL